MSSQNLPIKETSKEIEDNVFISLNDLIKEQNRLYGLCQSNIKKKRKRPSQNNRVKTMGDWDRMVKKN
ncbi:unnamed protein product [Rhizophagus irregularis]|nr:unnamed protein product [Rhizophagus irregularis]